MIGDVFEYKENALVGGLFITEWGYAIEPDQNEFRTFCCGKDIHFWRFALSEIPHETFSVEASI